MLITPSTLKKAERELKKCPHIGDIVKQHGPCTITPEKNDPFDALVTMIIGQQLSVKAADTIEKRVRILVGKQIRPKKLLATEPDILRSAGLSWRKVEYVHGIAEAVLKRQLSFNKMVDMSNDEVTKELVKLRGVGQWTAEMYMMFVLGRMDIFSSLDVGLQRGMRILFDADPDDLKAMDKLAEIWRPYRTVASWYLWKVVD